MIIQLSYILLKIGIIAFYLADAFTKLSSIYNLNMTGAPFKIIYLLFILILILISFNKKAYLILIGVMALFILFLFSQIYLNSSISHLTYNIGYFFKYVYIFFVFLIAQNLLYNQIKLNKILIYFKIIIAFNSILILLGLIFNITIFETYVLNNQNFAIYRFGYNGLINSQADSAFIYSIAIMYLYFIKKNIYDNILFYFILFSSLFIGTKSMYLFLILFAIYILFKKYKNKRFIRNSIFIFIFIFIFLLDSINIAEILNIFTNSFEYIIFNIEKNGLLYTMLSGRNELFEIRFLNSVSINPEILLFGGQNSFTSLIELQLVDLIFFFGIFGTTLYITLYLVSIGKIFFQTRRNIIFISFLLLISMFSGHFFDNNSIVIILVTVITYLKSLYIFNEKNIR